MYFVDWVEASSGNKYYRDLTTLFEATFHAAGVPETPRWVDRLAIEMNSKRRWRKEWVKRISSPSGKP
jgi:hypothetical protein